MPAPSQPMPPDGGPVSARWLNQHISGFVTRAPGAADAELLGQVGLTDDRRRVLETHEPPFRMICSIVTTRTNSGGAAMIGTGFLVGPRTVLTAAHVLFEPARSTDAAQVRVTPGRDDTGELPGVGHELVGESAFRFHPLWRQHRRPEHDLAAIRLSRRLGDTLSWFWLGGRPLADGEITGRLVHVAGYPDTVSTSIIGAAQQPRGRHLYFDRNVFAAPQGDAQLAYLADTSVGQSGGPAYIWPDPGGQAHIVTVAGVHCYSDEPSANLATRINAANHELIREWITADG